jgi:aminoglycoside phosphotransferase (APT) family kinase protein
VNALADPDILGRWLDRQGLEPGEPLTVEPLTGGRSNAMFRITRGAGDWVLRRPAAVAVDRADSGMLREAQILQGLAGSAVPHPGIVAVCADRSVLGCAFYLMERVEGRTLFPLPAEWDTPEGRDQTVAALIDALGRLHDFDWRGAGLSDLGRPDGFHERQVTRWTRQLNSYGGREIPGTGEVSDWLRGHIPASFTPTLMHGDYHMMNVLMGPGHEPAVAAILDWETATIGDPLLDLAGFCETWSGYAAAGWPSAGEMTEAYRAARGLADLPDLRYYRVLYRFRLAVLLEGIFQRAQRDQARGPQPDMGDMAIGHMREAAAIARNPKGDTADVEL